MGWDVYKQVTSVSATDTQVLGTVCVALTSQTTVILCVYTLFALPLFILGTDVVCMLS